jgi:pyruvate dehydrogenase E2 component (dihydrolipoamide acetyltransferase)
LSELAEQARGGRLRLEAMQGATFTISNQGGIGGTSFTPIVSHPQVAILGISRLQPRLALVDGQVQERSMLPLSLSYDHRVINGADAARFLARLSAELTSCFHLLIRI